MYGYIYKTTNLINDKIYIGQKKYKCDNKIDYTYLGSGVYLKRAIQKYGRINFKLEVIEECEDKEALNQREIYWINYYNANNPDIGYNIAAGGQGGDLGKQVNKKISESLKGKNTWTKNTVVINNGELTKHVHPEDVSSFLLSGWVLGQIKTEAIISGYAKAKITKQNKPEAEKRLAIEKANLSRKLTIQRRTKEEQKLINKHISESRLKSEHCKTSWNCNLAADEWMTSEHKRNLIAAVSKPKTEEHKKHLSEARKLKGLSKGKNNPRAKKVICLNTGVVYNYSGEAAEQLGLCVGEIRKCCTGVRKDIKGLKFKYYGN